jgi:predicted Zn-dependent protease
MAREGREFFYIDKHLIQDADIHNRIIADGDDAAARAVSNKIAKRIGLTDDEIAALSRPRGKGKKKLKTFDPNQPRDEDGKWTGGGGGSGSSEPTTPGDKQLLISHGPSFETLTAWKLQIGRRQQELEAAGQMGSDEDNNLQKMSIALQTWANTSEEDRRSGKWGGSFVYSYPENSETSALQAIVTTQFNETTRVALTEGKGGIDHDAMVKAFKMTITDYSESHSAERIENNEFFDETAMIKAAEEAGFRKIGGTSGGVQQMIWGTSEEQAAEASTQATLEHMPVPIDIGEGTGSNFKAAVASAFASIPTRALKTMADRGVKIRAGAKLTELKPELKGVHPRGWPAGTTWDTAEGCFDRSSKEVLVTELYRPIGKREFAPSTRVRGVALHESGHAFDQALDTPSANSKSFAEAYKADKKAISKDDKHKLKYFMQKGNAGPSEAFAEVFAWVTGQAGSLRYDIRPSFPRVTKLIKDAADRGVWLETIA